LEKELQSKSDQNFKLQQEISLLKKENEQYKHQIENNEIINEMASKNQDLKTEIENMKIENQTVNQNFKKFKEENQQLKKDLYDERNQVEAFRIKIEEYNDLIKKAESEKENETHEKLIAELKDLNISLEKRKRRKKEILVENLKKNWK